MFMFLAAISQGVMTRVFAAAGVENWGSFVVSEVADTANDGPLNAKYELVEHTIMESNVFLRNVVERNAVPAHRHICRRIVQIATEKSKRAKFASREASASPNDPSI